MATMAGALQWVRVCNAQARPVRIGGDVDSATGRHLIGQATALGGEIAVERSEPAPWSGDWTSLMWAASNGLADVVTDLLERGATADAPRRMDAPYRLAMRGGHIPVMAALRAGGVVGPRVAPPPEAPDAFVMRTYVGFVFWWLAPIAPVVALVVAAITGEWMWLVVGLIIGVAIAALGLFAHVVAGLTRVAVDGPFIYYHRFARWRGPVDLRRLAAVGLRVSIHRRSPTLLRLANTQDGEPFSRRTKAGFDDETFERLQARPDLKVLTIYESWNFLRPGLERYVAAHVDVTQTLIATDAQPLFRAAGRP